jgi:hypothetical protein
MSEIPFVNRLGDALETAITTQRAPRRRGVPRQRRLLVIAVATAVAAGGSLAIAHILSSPTKLATNSSIGCYMGANHGEAYFDPGDRTPIEACARVFRKQHLPVPALVVCDDHGMVEVSPGSGAEACRRQGLTPLPRGYSAAHAKVQALAHAIRLIEMSSDCIPPPRLAARVQALLKRSRWEGWRVHLGAHDGCGSVSELQGDGSRSISASFNYDARTLDVYGGRAHRSTENLLWGRHGVGASLSKLSGRRCYTQSGLRREIRRRLARTHRQVTFTVSKPWSNEPAGTPPGEFNDARQARLAAGCAIEVSEHPAADGLGLVIELWQNG